jgi:hypothetical protein
LIEFTFCTLGPPSVTNLTITGFSLPATKPNPNVGLRCKTTSRGSGGGSLELKRSGASYVVVLFK